MKQRAAALMFLIGLMQILAGGCAVNPAPAADDPIRNADFQGPTLQAVRATGGGFIGTQVRWGGTIARVENRRNETWLEIVEFPLARSGRPDRNRTDDSAGRFIARVPGFLDPAIYAPDRLISVVGRLEPVVERAVGEYPYRFPLVAVTRYQLWEERKEPDVIVYPPDPFRDGYWGPSFYWRWHRW